MGDSKSINVEHSIMIRIHFWGYRIDEWSTWGYQCAIRRGLGPARWSSFRKAVSALQCGCLVDEPPRTRDEKEWCKIASRKELV